MLRLIIALPETRQQRHESVHEVSDIYWPSPQMFLAHFVPHVRSANTGTIIAVVVPAKNQQQQTRVCVGC